MPELSLIVLTVTAAILYGRILRYDRLLDVSEAGRLKAEQLATQELTEQLLLSEKLKQLESRHQKQQTEFEALQRSYDKVYLELDQTRKLVPKQKPRTA